MLNEALENKGVANEIKSKLRAEVFSILEDCSSEKPVVSQENLLINELIREYMDFNHYKYSKSVFQKGKFWMRRTYTEKILKKKEILQKIEMHNLKYFIVNF